MKQPLEILYYQLVNGVPYASKIVNGKLERTTPIKENVIYENADGIIETTPVTKN
jgi:hypothetical protein